MDYKNLIPVEYHPPLNLSGFNRDTKFKKNRKNALNNSYEKNMQRLRDKVSQNCCFKFITLNGSQSASVKQNGYHWSDAYTSK